MTRGLLKQVVFACGLMLALAAPAAAQTAAPVAAPARTPPAHVEAHDFPEVPDVVEVPIVGEDLVPPAAQSPVFERSGVLIETLDGQIVSEQASEQTFNPASNVKLVTALVALRTLGPQHRFASAVWTTGTFDQVSGTVTGDLVVSGRDPSFRDEHAVMLARELNRLGVRTVTGDLIVAPRFSLNFSPSSLRSGERLYDTLDATRRPASATRAWFESRAAAGEAVDALNLPSVAVMGAVYVDAVPPGAKLVLTHRSSTLVDVLKVLLCYSNNFMADRLGDVLGGPAGLTRFLVTDLKLPAHEVRLASASGLGVNRLTPDGMMKIFRALRADLARHNLSPADIMPVAGIDPGTLEKRYRFSAGRGSIIAKTGTLPRTDGGASSLVGQFRTRSGETLLFVIFNQRGSVVRFRGEQDRAIADLQSLRGGPAPFAYTPHTLAMRLADTELDAARSKDEYEPNVN